MPRRGPRPAASGGRGQGRDRVARRRRGPRAGDVVLLRVRPPAGASARRYRIVPDASKPYSNAVWPWDPNPCRCLGLAKAKRAGDSGTDRQGPSAERAQGPRRRVGGGGHGRSWRWAEREPLGELRNGSSRFTCGDSTGWPSSPCRRREARARPSSWSGAVGATVWRAAGMGRCSCRGAGSRNTICLCKYDVVWCPNYRHQVLVGAVEKRLRRYSRRSPPRL
jgi:hypothetical protein